MLKGSLVAIVTPMQAGGALDLRGLAKLVDFHVANGTSGIVVVGTTGESPTVSVEEHCLLIKSAVEAAAGRVPVIAGTGANATAEAIALTGYAKKVGRELLPVGRAVLQQAHAGRALPPFPHHRRERRPAADPLQRAEPHRRRSRQRDGAALSAGPGHHRHQGRNRRPGARQRTHPRAARGGARRLRRLQRRRPDRAAA